MNIRPLMSSALLSLLLVACGGGGGGSSSSGGTTPAPAVSLGASPTSVISGNTSTLTWTSTNATSCTATGGWSGAKAVSGNETSGALTADTTFTLSCTGAGGTGQASTTVTVTSPSPTAPTVSLSALPTSVSSGASSALTWSSTNATSCTASGGWSGGKATSGTQSTAALTSATTFTLSCTGAGGTAQASVTVTIAAAGASLYPLRTESGKRYLIDALGRPFLIQGDAAWSLIAQVSRENADLYLETRRQQGFNTVLVNLIEHQFADNAPRNFYGTAPFSTAGDFSTPNEAYFAHAEYVISKARDKGILVLLAPAYMGYQGGSEGWYQEMSANGAAKLRTYGQYVATRFSAYDNILWVQGGDYDPPDKTLARAVANGIRDIDTNGKWLQTFHGGRGTGALEFLNTSSDPWLTLSNIYTDTNTVVTEALAQNSSSSLPFFLIEAGYENNDVDGAGVRAQAYQAVLSGTTGQLMGNFPVWHFGANWQSALTAEGAATLGRLPELFQNTAINWWNLVPDSTGTVLTSAPGAGIGRAVAARMSDGSAVVVFTPATRALTLNLSRLSGPNVSARWFDPTTGTLTTISGSPFTNTGSRTFTPPSANSGGDADFVLVLVSQP